MVVSDRDGESTGEMIRRLWRQGWKPADIVRATGAPHSRVYRTGERMGLWVQGWGAQRERMTSRRCAFLELRLEGFSRLEAAEKTGVSKAMSYPVQQGLMTPKANSKRFVPAGPDAERYNRLMALLEFGRKDIRIAGQSIPFAAVDKTISPRYLSITDREYIADCRREGMSMRAIARKMGRAPSTISREPARDCVHGGAYRPCSAHRLSVRRRLRPKPRKLDRNKRLAAAVDAGLKERLSPEQIAGRLPVDYPDDQTMRVSHETIYQSLFIQGKGHLKKDIQQALRRGRARRRSQVKRKRPRFGDEMLMISDRPAEVADRAVPGHWEGDLIIGKAGQSAIGTLVERSTRYVMLLHLPDKHDAVTVKDKLIETIEKLPQHLRASLTWDRGREMAHHKQFSVKTGCPVYFCDPASPWQRGSNENTNGLLRQYFPKGTDLSVHTETDLEFVACQLNRRPRKTLGFYTPAEKLAELLNSHPINDNECCNDH